jgi:outer membrane lipoprotein SlyB
MLLAASVAALALTGVSALATQPTDTNEQARQKTEADVRYEALQAQARQQAEDQRQAQLRYEQGVAEAAAAQRRYDQENARYQAQLQRSREAQADYERRLREHEEAVGARAERNASPAQDRTNTAGASTAPLANDSRTCEQQRRQARRRGRTAGGVIGGVAGGLLGNSTIGRLASIATLAPVGALIGDAIARRLDCHEQLQAAHATEEALRGGVGATSTWTSETRPGVTGSSTVVAEAPVVADASTPNSAQCLTVTDIIIVDGEETRAPKRMCRRPPSNAFVRV